MDSQIKIITVTGFCRAAIISLAADFNKGAKECECQTEGSIDQNCDKIGGQCPCKDNIIGRQCTRCAPDFFGYPDCKQCNCPPTARCNELTGKVIIFLLHEIFHHVRPLVFYTQQRYYRI